MISLLLEIRVGFAIKKRNNRIRTDSSDEFRLSSRYSHEKNSKCNSSFRIFLSPKSLAILGNFRWIIEHFPVLSSSHLSLGILSSHWGQTSVSTCKGCEFWLHQNRIGISRKTCCLKFLSKGGFMI